ncbi:MAG TPA: hypothetical protein VER17_19435 [Tepidisphaeraceae bacterium]|nr:hypothetical protein [Tepidisphaeraceae bacterium]
MTTRRPHPWLGQLAPALAATGRFFAPSVRKTARAGRPGHVVGLAILLPLLPLLAAAPLDLQPASQLGEATSRPVRFATVDVRLDPKGQPLAAYQLEFVAPASVALVGIEGGDHAAFKQPPFYDPAALRNSRVILAAFNTAADLPRGETRVARLHVQIQGSAAEPLPQWSVKVIVASDAQGTTLPSATASLASEGASR